MIIYERSIFKAQMNNMNHEARSIGPKPRQLYTSWDKYLSNY